MAVVGIYILPALSFEADRSPSIPSTDKLFTILQDEYPDIQPTASYPEWSLTAGLYRSSHPPQTVDIQDVRPGILQVVSMPHHFKDTACLTATRLPRAPADDQAEADENRSGRKPKPEVSSTVIRTVEPWVRSKARDCDTRDSGDTDVMKILLNQHQKLGIRHLTDPLSGMWYPIRECDIHIPRGRSYDLATDPPVEIGLADLHGFVPPGSDVGLRGVVITMRIGIDVNDDFDLVDKSADLTNQRTQFAIARDSKIAQAKRLGRDVMQTLGYSNVEENSPPLAQFGAELKRTSEILEDLGARELWRPVRLTGDAVEVWKDICQLWCEALRSRRIVGSQVADKVMRRKL